MFAFAGAGRRLCAIHCHGVLSVGALTPILVCFHKLEITPPSNFNHTRDGTCSDLVNGGGFLAKQRLLKEPPDRFGPRRLGVGLSGDPCVPDCLAWRRWFLTFAEGAEPD